MNCHPDRSAAKWRDPRFGQSPSKADGGIALPFVIPSEVEGSAVLQARPGNVFRQNPCASGWRVPRSRFLRPVILQEGMGLIPAEDEHRMLASSRLIQRPASTVLP